MGSRHPGPLCIGPLGPRGGNRPGGPGGGCPGGYLPGGNPPGGTPPGGNPPPIFRLLKKITPISVYIFSIFIKKAFNDMFLKYIIVSEKQLINFDLTGGETMKPVIGITTFCECKSGKEVDEVNYNYIQSIVSAGGTPVLLPVVEGEDIIEGYLSLIDGIMFTGGNDISPILYGENPIKEVVSVSKERDSFEFSLYNKAYKRNIPMFGICRGAQLINTAAGGTLYQDINAQKENSISHSQSENPSGNLYHSVKISKDSKLYSIMGSEELCVNSFHHQSVKEAAPGFNITALSPDGIVEAIESTGKNFILGVQWHPERLVDNHPEFLKLFKALIDASNVYRTSRTVYKKYDAK